MTFCVILLDIRLLVLPLHSFREEGAYNDLVALRECQNDARIGMTSSTRSSNVTFHVNSLNFPNSRNNSRRQEPVSGATEALSATSSTGTIADSSALHEATNADDQPHEYFILDPVV